MFVKEWPLGLFKKFYPDYMDLLADVGIDISDPDYIVRVQYHDDGTILQFEAGYVSDEWHLKV